MLDEAIHPGDADGREQSADGGWNQAHQQRHQHWQRERGAAVTRVWIEANADQHENDRQAGEQDAERDFVGRLLALRALDQRDHAVEEGLARVGGDAHLDVVGDDRGAAGNGAPVAAAFANDRGGLAGDRGLVDRGDTFDHFAVAGNDVAGLDQHHVTAFEFRRRDQLDAAAGSDQLGLGFGAGLAQVVGLRLAASLGHRLGEVGEQHREPQPERDLKLEGGKRAASEEEIAEEDHGHGERGHFDHEHDRVAGLDPRVKLAQRINQRALDDLAVPQRRRLTLSHRNPLLC